MSDLKARLVEAMKTAMRQQDKPTLSVIRMMLAAIKQKEVDERIDVTDADVLQILDKMVKQRQDAASQYQAAGRDELYEQESFEITVIQAYLPKQLSEDEILAIVDAAIQETSAQSAKDMGNVMQAIKPQLQGRADMKKVSQQVKARLSDS